VVVFILLTYPFLSSASNPHLGSGAFGNLVMQGDFSEWRFFADFWPYIVANVIPQGAQNLSLLL